jgi:glycerol kinase
MAKNYFLGIDQGTSQTTAIIIDEASIVAAVNSVPIKSSYPLPGYVEQDPLEILASIRQACTPLLAQFPVAAAGLANQGETFVAWDRSTGKPLTPAVVWQDKRGQSICARLRPQVEPAWLQKKTGLRLDTYFSAPKLSFILQEQLELRKKAADGELLFGCLDSWIIWQGTNNRKHVTDPSTASRTLLYDINRLAWDDDLLSLFGVPRAMLPQVQLSAGFFGELAFIGGIPLFSSLVDQQAALFGQGCFSPGEVKCTLGTGGFLLMNLGNKPHFSPGRLLTTIAWRLADGTTFAFDGGILAAGAAMEWLGKVGILADVRQSALMAERSQNDELVFIPSLAGLGAPHWQTDNQGAFFGLTRASSANDLTRAALNGIACRIYEIVRAMEEDAGIEVARLKMDGGLAANTYLMQRLADLLAKEVEVSASVEATAIGAAELAAHSVAGISLSELKNRRLPAKLYSPRPFEKERSAYLSRWYKALEALHIYHDNSIPSSRDC